MQTDGIPAEITDLWDRVRDALAACGDPSPRDIDRLAASCGLRLPSSTVEGWFKSWSVVPSWEKFDSLVKALGAEQDLDWRALHGAAQRADRQRKASGRRQADRRPEPSRTVAELAGTGDDRVRVSAEVTSVPPISAKITHRIDRTSVTVTAVAALVVIAAVAVLLSAFGGASGEPEVRGAREGVTPSSLEPSFGPPSVPEWRPPSDAQLRAVPGGVPGGVGALYVGDTLAVENQRVVQFFAHGRGRVRVTAVAYRDAAVCDYLAGRPGTLVPGRHRLGELVKAHKPRVIALQFWGFSTRRSPCMAGASPDGMAYAMRYVDDTRKLVEEVASAAREAGIGRPRLVWVLQPPDKSRPERVRALNERALVPVARAHGDSVVDAGSLVSQAANVFAAARKPDDRYRWLQFLPCTRLEHQTGYCTRGSFGGTIMVHADGEDFSFCLNPGRGPCVVKSAGLVRYSRAIAHAIVQAVR
ncbi:hypothetical protein [Spirillospora sp. CA-294931]|uniref:hypothetical protein n=1 Tax=Spirillospora sp. CA-294931 TaxID=3240042 RepID=UPI003D94C673